MITSVPFFKFKALIATSSAAVPLETAIPYFLLKDENFFKFFDEFSLRGYPIGSQTYIYIFYFLLV